MVRGEILPSAWILQPLTVEGKEITRVIYLAQVCTPCSLTAPGSFLFSCSTSLSAQVLGPESSRLKGFLGHSKASPWGIKKEGMRQSWSAFSEGSFTRAQQPPLAVPRVHSRTERT